MNGKTLRAAIALQAFAAALVLTVAAAGSASAQTTPNPATPVPAVAPPATEAPPPPPGSTPVTDTTQPAHPAKKKKAAPKSAVAKSASAKSAPAEPPAPVEGETHLPAGRFGTVTVYIPDGTPKSVAIFLSGDGGWNLGVVSMAKSLVDMGAVVIGVDIRQYLGALGKAAQRPNAPCQLIAGDFENLSHQIQKEIGMFVYHVPVLVGYSSGATVVYAVLVQSPPGTFAGALSLGFCPDQDFAGAAVCAGAGLHYTQGKKNDLIFEPAKTLKQPWVAFQGQKDEVCAPAPVDVFAAQTTNGQVVKLPLVGHGFSVERNWMPQFLEAYSGITAHVETPPVRPQEIGDLPTQEVTAAPDTHGDEMALLMTGDGGWAGLDQELAARLAADGVPTVGLNSLKYFWTGRTPQETAQDVARIINHYLSAWNKQRVLLVGYSFGADVLPFVVNRLPPDLRARVATVNLLGIDSNASFEIKIAGWVGEDDSGPPTRPELSAISGLPILCIYGEGESDSICPELPKTAGHTSITLAEIGTGHHFGGEYATLAQRILAYARGPHPPT
jgi:type IV secretory pathway VirJ component